MPERAYEPVAVWLAREEATRAANVALCASEGHTESRQKTYCTICSRCSTVLEYT
jgi:hypothetical protein